MSRRLKQVTRGIARYLAIGLISTPVVATVCAVIVDVTNYPATSYSHGELTVSLQSGAGATRVIWQQERVAWGPMQATGPPDTVAPGDYRTAWAPASQDGAPEWLLLTYEKPIRIRFVDVYETHHPGALRQISLVTNSGDEIPAWRGIDPILPIASSGIAHIPIRVDGRETPAVRKIKLYQGKPSVPGWNEVDAVGATDDKGAMRWAENADASSFWGQPAVTAPQVDPLEILQSWSGLDRPQAVKSLAAAKSELHGADARGWPMVSLWRPLRNSEVSAMPSPSNTLTLGTIDYTGFLNAGTSGSQATAATISFQPKSVASLPWRPVWFGLVVDTLLFATGAWIIWTILTRPRRFFAEVSRMKRGCCVQCGYNLNYDFVPGCPECGWRREITAK